MPVMNYRKGTEKEKSWIIEETSFNEKYTGKCESVFTPVSYTHLACIREIWTPYPGRMDRGLSV